MSEMDPVIALRNTYNCLSREASNGNPVAQAKLRVFTDARKEFSTDSSPEYIQFVKSRLDAMKVSGKKVREAKQVLRTKGCTDQEVREIVSLSKSDFYTATLKEFK